MRQTTGLTLKVQYMDQRHSVTVAISLPTYVPRTYPMHDEILDETIAAGRSECPP
jgi:hypothetical protein